VPPELARIGILPLRVEGDTLYVAAIDPLQVLAFDELSLRTGLKVSQVLAKPSAVREAIRCARRGEDALQELLKHAPEEAGSLAIAEVPVRAAGEVAVDANDEDGQIVRLVNLLVSDAIRGRASDIHVEPEKERTRIRFRVDGELAEVSTVPAALHPFIASR